MRLLWAAGLTISGYLILLMGSDLILYSLIGHGGITAENVRALWWIMVALGGVLAGRTMSEITSVGFYALGETRTPTKLSIWTYTVYIPVKVGTFLQYGLMGLAIATSIHVLINFLLQYITLEKELSRRSSASLESVPMVREIFVLEGRNS